MKPVIIIANFQRHFRGAANFTTQFLNSSLKNIFEAATRTDFAGYIPNGTFACGAALGAFYQTRILEGKGRALGGGFEQREFVPRPHTLTSLRAYVQQANRLSA